jgi:hypothetical protein
LQEAKLYQSRSVQHPLKKCQTVRELSDFPVHTWRTRSIDSSRTTETLKLFGQILVVRRRCVKSELSKDNPRTGEAELLRRGGVTASMGGVWIVMLFTAKATLCQHRLCLLRSRSESATGYLMIMAEKTWTGERVDKLFIAEGRRVTKSLLVATLFKFFRFV